MQAGFDIEISADPPTTLTVRMSGELDLAARPVVAEQVTAALVEKRTSNGWSSTSGASSSATRAGWARCWTSAAWPDKLGATIVLRSPSAGVARVLDIAGIDDLLPRE